MWTRLKILEPPQWLKTLRKVSIVMIKTLKSQFTKKLKLILNKLSEENHLHMNNEIRKKKLSIKNQETLKITINVIFESHGRNFFT